MPGKKKPFEPKVIAQDYTPQGLLFTTIELRKKRIITITEPKHGVEALRGKFANEVLELGLEDEALRNILLLTYSALAALSTGNVPKPLELQEMARADVKFWIEQAKILAPDFFDWMDVPETEAEQEQALQKKRRKRLR
jgi:hypothetical protein